MIKAFVHRVPSTCAPPPQMLLSTFIIVVTRDETRLTLLQTSDEIFLSLIRHLPVRSMKEVSNRYCFKVT